MNRAQRRAAAHGRRPGVRGVADAMLENLAHQVRLLRAAYPLDDYAGRLYYCDECGSIDSCCAPTADLVDDYPCPSCTRPQTPVTAAGVPL